MGWSGGVVGGEVKMGAIRREGGGIVVGLRKGMHVREGRKWMVASEEQKKRRALMTVERWGYRSLNPHARRYDVTISHIDKAERIRVPTD